MQSLLKNRRRAPQACIICHKKKVRCDLAEGKSPCTNCKISHHECKPRERKRKNYTTSPSSPRALQRPRLEIPESLQDIPAVPAEQWQSAAPDVAPTQNSRESYVGRGEYLAGDLPFIEDMTKTRSQSPKHPLSETDLEILRLQKAFDLPPRSIQSSLIDSFMKFCAPWTPIVQNCWLEESDGKQPSILLLQAVFLAGSRVSSAPLLYATSEDYYKRARALFFSGIETDTITNIIVVCLLQWWHPTGPEKLSIDTSGFWIRIGVGMAHQVGLHKEPREVKDRLLRRRIWWSLVARDSVISAGTGRPRAINIEDSDVLPPSMDDFQTPDTKSRAFVTYTTTCQLLGDITEFRMRRSFSAAQEQHFENALYRWIKSLPSELHLFQPSGENILNPYNFEARQIALVYFVILIILRRTPTSGACLSAESLVASSFISGIFEEFLARDEIRFLGPAFVFYAFVAGLATISGYRQSGLQITAGQDLRILRASLQQLSKRWGSALGPLRALQKVEEAIKPNSQLPLPKISQAMLPFFHDFGPILCRNWKLLYDPFRNVGGVRKLGDEREAESLNAYTRVDDLAQEKVSEGEHDMLGIEGLPETSLPSQFGIQVDSGQWFEWDPIGSWLLEDWINEDLT